MGGEEEKVKEEELRKKQAELDALRDAHDKQVADAQAAQDAQDRQGIGLRRCASQRCKIVFLRF